MSVTMSWKEFSQLNLVGRDLEIKNETLVERARIQQISDVGRALMIYLDENGYKARAINFTKVENEPWVHVRVLPYPISNREDSCLPEDMGDGTIKIRTDHHRCFIIHREGDNLHL